MREKVKGDTWKLLIEQGLPYSIIWNSFVYIFVFVIVKLRMNIKKLDQNVGEIDPKVRVNKMGFNQMKRKWKLCNLNVDGAAQPEIKRKHSLSDAFNAI